MLLSQQPQLAPRREATKLFYCFAQNAADIEEAQRLRYKVFAEEMGARLSTRKAGVDEDIFDPYCDHLLVRDGDSNEVVGTYRILSPEKARKIGGFYSEGEFDLTRLAHLSDRMVEVGRSCVHPDYRSGAVITLLWAGLAAVASALLISVTSQTTQEVAAVPFLWDVRTALGEPQ